MSLMEAMACQTAVISTYSGAIPEIAGDTALLCPPADAQALAGALRSLVNRPEQARELGAAACERARALFDIHRFARDLDAVYGTIRRS